MNSNSKQASRLSGPRFPIYDEACKNLPSNTNGNNFSCAAYPDSPGYSKAKKIIPCYRSENIDDKEWTRTDFNCDSMDWKTYKAAGEEKGKLMFRPRRKKTILENLAQITIRNPQIDKKIDDIKSLIYIGTDAAKNKAATMYNRLIKTLYPQLKQEFYDAQEGQEGQEYYDMPPQKDQEYYDMPPQKDQEYYDARIN